MNLSRADVAKVALLARLQFDDEQLDEITTQLQAIVAFVEQLDELDTEGVAPMAHASEIHDVFADDAVHESLPRQLALRSAPKQDGGCYRVPAVLGD